MTMDYEMKKMAANEKGSLGIIDGCAVVECSRAYIPNMNGYMYYADHIYEVMLSDSRVVYTCNKVHCGYFSDSHRSVQTHTANSQDCRARRKSYSNMESEDVDENEHEDEPGGHDRIIELADDIIAASHELGVIGRRIKQITQMVKNDEISSEVIEKARKYDDIVSKVNESGGS